MNKMLIYNMKLNQEYFIIHGENNWRLVRNKFYIYDIMNSDDNTEEELKEFVKNHTLYDYVKAQGLTSIFVCAMLFILNIICNVTNNEYLKYFVLGGLFVACIEMLIRVLVNIHNNEVKDRIYKEDLKYIEKKTKEILEEREKKHAKKRNISKDKENK